MRSFWSRVPMFRVVFALITGILLEILCNSFFPTSIKSVLVAGTILAISLIFIGVNAGLKKVNLAYRLRLFNGLALQAGLITLAYLMTWFYTQKNYPGHFSNFLTGKDIMLVSINEEAVLHDKVVTITGRVNEVVNSTGHFKTSGLVQLGFLRDSICEQINYGDVLLIKSKADTTEGPKNPYERNYKTMLAFHNIYHKAFVTRSDWKLVDTAQGNYLIAAAFHLRKNFLKVLTRYVHDRSDFGVASAIMLGYKDYLGFDTYQAYADSGTVQVLSISAFHVGIMFFMLNFLLQWMDKRSQKMVIVKTVLIIAFIWFYACLTGLSLPVLRCATMFSLIQFGMALNRNVNRFNMLAGSAVLLLLFNPFVLTETGFQLSYLAVLGIYYLQPKIANLLVFKNRDVRGVYWFFINLINFIWQLTAASIAAQIAILPLCLFYFNQFPNLFLLTNVVVVPLSNLLIFTGTVLFAVSHISYLNDAAGWFFNHILSILDNFIFRVSSLPYSVTKGVALSVAEMLLLYIIIALLCWFSEDRKNKVLISAFAVLLLFSSFTSYKKIARSGQKQMVVYAVPKQKAIAFISDNTVFYDFDSTLLCDRRAMQLNISPHWYNSGIGSETPIYDKAITALPGLYSSRIAQGRVVLFEGKKILVADSLSTADYNGTRLKLKVDLVILSGTLKITLPVLKKSVDFDEVVFDSRCRPASRKRWKKDCAELNLTCWDVNSQGAYVWNLGHSSP